MFINIHMLQNHSPGNLNRDDIGAPKTCYFGGVLRTRISSQCLKRSIRLSDHFSGVLEGLRTRRLLHALSDGLDDKARKRAFVALQKCGLISGKAEIVEGESLPETDVIVFTTKGAVEKMRALVQDPEKTTKYLADDIRNVTTRTSKAADMALFGRMLEPPSKDWKDDTKIEAAAQVAHAMSTHEHQAEIDYFTATDDISGTHAGAGHIGETVYTSACFYKYMSVHWEELVRNLYDDATLAKKAIIAFVRAATYSIPTGKQNSFAAHNLPDLVVVEFREDMALSYANAFLSPAIRSADRSPLVQSATQLRQYMQDMDSGYGGSMSERLWFSPNGRIGMMVDDHHDTDTSTPLAIQGENITRFDDLIAAVATKLPE